MKLRILILVGVCSLALAACGGSSSSSGSGGGSGSSGGSSALSKADLDRKATLICQTADDSSNRLKSPGDFATNPEAATSYLEKLSPIAHKQNDDLHKLTPAADVKADWDTFMAKSQALTDFFDDVLKKAKAKDPNGLKELESAPTGVTKDFSDAAKAVGATGCQV